MRNHINKTFLGLGLCLVGLGALTGCEDTTQQASASFEMPPPLVGTMQVIREDVPLQSTYMGQTMGHQTVEVRAQVGGMLLERYYREGEYVEKGQLLFEIDAAPYLVAMEQAQSQLTSAEAQYNNAARELSRIRSLYSSNAVSQRDRDQAQAAFDSAKAMMETAQSRVNEVQIQLGYTQVVAPISGFTSRETKNAGNLVSPDPQGGLLTTINQTDPMYVTFAIPSAEYLMLKSMEAEGRAISFKEDAPVALQLLEGGAYPYLGKVTFIDTQVDPYTSVVRARAEFPNPDGVLMPGQYASVIMGNTSLKNVIMVPQKAVLQTGNGAMVYTLGANSVASLTPVVIERAFGGEFLISSGLSAGDVLVIDGINKVYPGAPVTEKQEIRPPRRTELPAAAGDQAGDQVGDQIGDRVGSQPEGSPAALALAVTRPGLSRQNANR